MTGTAPGTGRLLAWMALAVIAGAPFIYLIWEFINHLLAGRFVAREAGLALVGLAGAWGVLRLVARRVSGWEGGREDAPA